MSWCGEVSVPAEAARWAGWEWAIAVLRDGEGVQGAGCAEFKYAVLLVYHTPCMIHRRTWAEDDGVLGVNTVNSQYVIRPSNTLSKRVTKMLP